MADPQNTSNVKIYDRPERKGPSPIVLALGLMILLVVGFLAYKLVTRAPDTPAVSNAAAPGGAARPGAMRTAPGSP